MIKRRGLMLFDCRGSHCVHPIVATRETAPKKTDLLVIAVKTFDLRNVLESYEELARSCRSVLLVQSSIRLMEVLPSWIRSKSVAAAVMFGATGSALDCVMETAPGFVAVGSLVPNNLGLTLSVRQIVRHISPVLGGTHIHASLFSKVAFNIASVPFCVASGRPIGAAFELHRQVIVFGARALMDCAMIASKTKRLRDAKFGNIPVRMIGSSLTAAQTALEWLVGRYAAVFPSAVFDAARGRVSELSDCFGDMLDLANQHRVEVPFLSLLSREIGCLMSSRREFSRGTLALLLKRLS
jgi:ketopantoate reductase